MDVPDRRSPEVAAAAEALYGLPLEQFTPERKRLADERKRAGDKVSAALIGKLGKPNQSAWVVNQLHRHARVELDALFVVAEQLREGDLTATGEHQVTLGRLRARAAELLAEGGHAAGETVLRRVATTLQALSATGGYQPDPPGQLVGDRDPPGFEAHAGMAVLAPPARSVKPAPAPAAPDSRPAEAAADRERKREQERLARELERHERDAERALREVGAREADVADLRVELAAAEAALDQARGRADEAAREVAAARERVI